MSSQNRCPLCEEGQLHEKQGKNPVEYNGYRAELDFFFSVCDVCGAEQAAPEQTRHNKRAMSAFKKEADGLLTGKEVRALRKRLKLTQAQAAKVFGGGVVAFSKYESDDVMQSEAMDKLLRVASNVPGAHAFLATHAGMNGCAEPVPAAGWETVIMTSTSLSWSRPESGGHLKLVHSQDWNDRRYG